MNTLNCSVKTALFITAVFFLGCNNKVNNTSSINPPKDEINLEALMVVLDSVNQEISIGKYGLIDRFMVFKDDNKLADFEYSNDYKTIAKKYDTTNHQYNYHHPDWHPYYKDSKLHTLQSATKSVTSILLGIALEKNNNYDIDTKVMQFFKDYVIENFDERLNDITIEDLLTMRGGFKWNEGEYYDLSDDCIAMEASKNWIEFVLNKPFDSNPGEKWEYNSGISVLIGKIIREITGQRIEKFAEKTLFRDLGISEYYWKVTPKGEIDTEGGLYLKSEDFAKLGTLFLNNGIFNGKEVVNKKWIEASVSPKAKNLWPEGSVNVGYGYQWWTEDYPDGLSIYTANGYGGQYLMVVPSLNLFVVFNGWNTDIKPEKTTFFVLTKRLLPALQSKK